jgi:hypothetical protein
MLGERAAFPVMMGWEAAREDRRFHGRRPRVRKALPPSVQAQSSGGNRAF